MYSISYMTATISIITSATIYIVFNQELKAMGTVAHSSEPAGRGIITDLIDCKRARSRIIKWSSVLVPIALMPAYLFLHLFFNIGLCVTEQVLERLGSFDVSGKLQRAIPKCVPTAAACHASKG